MIMMNSLAIHLNTHCGICYVFGPFPEWSHRITELKKTLQRTSQPLIPSDMISDRCLSNLPLKIFGKGDSPPIPTQLFPVPHFSLHQRREASYNLILISLLQVKNITSYSILHGSWRTDYSFLHQTPSYIYIYVPHMGVLFLSPSQLETPTSPHLCMACLWSQD